MNKEDKAKLKDLMDEFNQDGVKKLKGKDRRIVWGNEVAPLECVKTGVLSYDEITGGEPRGRWTVDYGVEGSGKSTWNYYKMSMLQKQGYICAVIDAEDGFDREWCQAQGVNMAELVIIPSRETFEDTLSHVRRLVMSGLVGFCLLDSIHGIAMKGELYKKGKGATARKERSLEDDTQALAARKIGQFIRIVGPVLGKSKTMFTIIGQAREEISAYSTGIHLSGGHQLKHHAACIRQWTRAKRDLWPVRKVEGKDVQVGYSAKITIEKTKLNANERQQVILPFLYGIGVGVVQANVDMAVVRGVVENPSTTWFHWNKNKLNGKSALYTFFEQNEAEYKALMEKVDAG